MTCQLLLISGSLRARSTNTAALRTAARLALGGIDAVVYDGIDHLPAFNPDDDTATPPRAVAYLRGTIHAADAVLFSVPEYAGALPGSFKNLLDWTIGDDHPRSIYNKPVAWLNASPRGAEGAHGELQTVLRYAHAAVAEWACMRIPITREMIGADGLVNDPAIRARIARLIGLLAEISGCGGAPGGADGHQLEG